MTRTATRRLLLAFAGALLLHAAAALLLPRLGGGLQRRPAGTAISLELRSAPAPSRPAPAPAPPVPAAEPRPGATAKAAPRSAPAGPGGPGQEVAATGPAGAFAAPAPPGAAAAAPERGTPEWKSAEGLASGPAAVFAPGWGVSRTLRDPGATLGALPKGLAGAGGGGQDGLPVRVPSREEALAEEQTRVKARLDSWIANDLARARAEGPRDGYWKDLGDELLRGFNVAWEVKDGQLPPSPVRNAVGEAVDEYLREADAWGRTGSATLPPVTAAGKPRPLADEFLRLPVEERGLRGTVLEHAPAALTLETAARVMEAGLARYPTRLVVRILLTQRPDGAIDTAEVAASSGNPIYDRLALAQARGLGVSGRLGPPPAHHLRSLWAFETDFLQLPPAPVAGCSFDGFVPADCYYPFQKRIHPTVRLEAIF